MIDKYMKNESFSNWILHNKFISKLLMAPQYYNIDFGDKTYQIIFVNGELYSYKFFISVLSSYDSYYYDIRKSNNKNKNEERKKITQTLLDINVLVEHQESHPYHKNAKPYISIKKGPRIDEFYNYLRAIDFDKKITLDEIYNLDVY